MTLSNRVSAAAAATAMVLIVSGALAAPPQTTGSFVINKGTIGGRERSYVLYEPRDVKPGAPLVFVFHGGGGDGPMAREGTGHEFDMLADRYGFIVIYPDGLSRSWTGCRKSQNRTGDRRTIDDVAFVDAMIEQEAARHQIDRKHIFALGHSMGGGLTYRLALERPDKFAAVAVISSNLPEADNQDCMSRSVPIPVMVINGTADPVNDYEGKTSARGRFRGRMMSTDETVQYFAGLNGLPGQPQITRLPHVDPSDKTWVERLSWSAPGKPGVVLLTVHGGGHNVPQPYYRYPSIVGAQTKDLDAPAAIWEFFAKESGLPVQQGQ